MGDYIPVKEDLSDLLEIIQWCKDNDKIQRQDLLKYLLKNIVRTGSGVCVNTVFTSPIPEYEDDNGQIIKQNFSCEYNCYFCPDEPARPENNNQKQWSKDKELMDSGSN